MCIKRNRLLRWYHFQYGLLGGGRRTAPLHLGYGSGKSPIDERVNENTITKLKKMEKFKYELHCYSNKLYVQEVILYGIFL